MCRLSIFSGKCLCFQEKLQRSGKSSEAAKQRSGIQAANAAACCLSGARAPVYCLLAADIICRNLKDLLPRLRIEWLLRALPDFGLSEDERKLSTSTNAIRIVLYRWKKAGKIEQGKALPNFAKWKELTIPFFYNTEIFLRNIALRYAKKRNCLFLKT